METFTLYLFAKVNTKQMGEIREMEKIVTCETWYETNGVSYDAFRMAFRELGLKAFAKKRVLTASEISRIESYPFRKRKPETKKRNSRKNSQTVSPPAKQGQGNGGLAPSRIAWPKFGLIDFLALAVYGHTALVWYEVSVIFAVPGFLAGVVLFAMKHTVTCLVKDPARDSLHPDALAVAFVLDGLAWYAHYTVFTDALPARLASQMGADGVFYTALILGGVVAAGAWRALYFIKQITISKSFEQ